MGTEDKNSDQEKKTAQDPDILSYEDEGVDMPDSDEYRDIPDFDKQKKNDVPKHDSENTFQINKQEQDYHSGVDNDDDDAQPEL